MDTSRKLLFVSSLSDKDLQWAEAIRDSIMQKPDNLQFLIADDSVKNDISGYIKREEIDLLVTFDLYGFECSTLAGGLSYNLLPCKQIHIVSEKNLPNEKYLANPLSIAMFFYCADEELYCYLTEKYADIPYLGVLADWKKEYSAENARQNAEALGRVIKEVMEICHM